jgi:hypothetical protein
MWDHIATKVAFGVFLLFSTYRWRKLEELYKSLRFGRYKATLAGIGFGLACLLGLVIRSETANGWFWNCALHSARMARLADNLFTCAYFGVLSPMR